MKKGLIIKSILILLIVGFITSTTYATTETSDLAYKQDIKKYVDQMNNIRKQFVAIAERGYLNYLEDQSNKDNANTVKLYIPQVEKITKELEKYAKEENLGKFQKVNVRTLLGAAQYLEIMGYNLVDYLTATESKEQYQYFDFHIRINQYIVNILGTILSDLN
ncbi:MAG: hypothetical protein ACRDDX_05850 [Cellulosilyticaceae bacterium]